MILPLEAQLQGFVLAIGIGVALGLLYDAFRIFRVLMQSPASHVFWMDILFCALSALVTFLLAVGVSYGEVRYYILLGEGTGFCVYYFTLGIVSIRIVRMVKKGLDFLLFHPLRTVIHWILNIFHNLAGRVFAFMKKIIGKIKNGLKRHKKIVYNNARNCNDKILDTTERQQQ